MSLVMNLLTAVAVAIVLLFLIFFYKFYIRPLMIMNYYKKQGVKHSYYEFLVGKYGYYKRSEIQHKDCMHVPKNFLKENPDCKYFMTNLGKFIQMISTYLHFNFYQKAEYVVIQFYDPQHIKEFYSNPNIQKHKFGLEIFNWFVNGFVFNEGKLHTRKRKIISQVFHFQLLNNLVPHICEILDELINKIQDNRVDSAIFTFQSLAADATTRLFFGNQLVHETYAGLPIPVYMSEFLTKFGSYSKSAVYCFFGIQILKFGSLRKIRDEGQGLKDFFKKHILKRIDEASADDLANKKRKDLIDFLVENKSISPIASENTISIEELVDEFISFYLAGMDTTGHTLGMICYYLCIYPEVKQKLYEEIQKYIKSPSDINSENIKGMNYLHAFVTETIRYFPVVDQLFVREAKTDIQIGDLKILKGTMLNVGIIENNYNPKYFKDPLEFNPDRWLDGSTNNFHSHAFIPFSSGRTNCIGQHFAQLEIKITIIKILQKLDLVLDSDYKLKSTYNFIVKPEVPIPITFKKRL